MASLLGHSDELKTALHAIQLMKRATLGKIFNEMLFKRSLDCITQKEVALVCIEKRTWRVQFELNLSFPPSLLSSFLNVGKEFDFSEDMDIKALVRSLCAQTEVDIQDLNNPDAKYFTLVLYRYSLEQSTSHLIELVMPYLHHACLAAYRLKNQSNSPLDILTSREREVLNWVSSGKTNSEISMILGISQNTVKNHVANILGKLNAPNRSAATALIRV